MRHSLLLKLMTNEENHNLLINAFENLMNTDQRTCQPLELQQQMTHPLPSQYMLKHQQTTTAFYQEPSANWKSILTKYQLISKCILLLQSIALLYNLLATDLKLKQMRHTAWYQISYVLKKKSVSANFCYYNLYNNNNN